uniref:non-specific serine/threonine protein kinase n=1 Tax=Clastoptera arizonana TaxID=38151 RepID=A0A1B6DQ53_9HEMI
MDTSTPEEEDFPGRLLHQAALWDNAELLEDLLRGDQHSHINSQDSWGRTPLHAASTTENSRCLRVLLQAGANPNIACGPRGENRTPLHVCSEHGFVGNVMLLVAHKGDLVARDSEGLTPLDIAEKGEHIECMHILKQAADSRELNRHNAHLALRDALSTGELPLIKTIISQLGNEAELVVNMAPNGCNTLLYTACEMGRKDIVKSLLEVEADGRIHPVTRYSPLYIACFKGHKDVVEILLKKFPELIQQYTVERWLPIHAAAINNHLGIMDLLLKFSYPQHLLSSYRDGDWEYHLAFDLNMKDMTGKNVLYFPCLLGSIKMVDLLLKFRVKATRTKFDGKSDAEVEGEILSPTRRRISDGILGIMSRLNIGSKSGSNDATERLLCPWDLDTYCNHNTETALHAAVRGHHGDVVSALLSAGANPNLLTQRGNEERDVRKEEDIICGISPLVEACRNRDIAIVDLLLKHGARDDDCRALAVAVKNHDDILTAKLLSIKAHPDPEHRINKKAMSEHIPATNAQFGALTSLTYSNMFANTAVMINWHCQRCQLSQIRPQWLIDAGLHVNPKLKLNPRSQDVVLYAITRLDVSNNSLTWLPLVVFQLQSLRYLNVSHNKIEKLPSESDCQQENEKEDKRKRKHLKLRQKLTGFSAPLLEELYLQYNRLEELPDELFSLPGLVTLDVSNNKLSMLPFKMWRAPKLKELNASFNLLKDLPAMHLEEVNDSASTCSVESSRSYDSQLSVASDTFNQLLSPEIEILPKSKYVQLLDLTQHNVWSRSVQVMEQISSSDEDNGQDCSHLSALNLAHNQFTAIPTVLSCLAVNLTRLNMSYNSLRSMSHITSYPSSIKQLDLSHNQVCCWPSLPQIETSDPMEQAAISCYAADSSSRSNKGTPGRRQAGRSLRTAILNNLCSHRRHLRLDNLRTLVLADNKITRLQLTTDDDGLTIQESDEQDPDWDVMGSSNPVSGPKNRLMFPNLSMLDLSNNQLKEIPVNIHDVSNLSVLNVGGNPEISELPPQMGLLSRLWNLNTRGCSLQEPLKSMIDSKKYKTMDVIGYLKSVLEDAKPYARMKLMIVGVQGIGKTSLLEQLRQEGSGLKKKPVEHWAKRMGNKNINTKTSKGTNISTVGVDIGDWVYEKKIRGHSSHGPVVFRTWDFGGQREYYATHQYFLSKRSLYLVVWKIPDGQRGIAEILQWLVNIQARAPNSPVLIIGTHYDLMREQYPSSRSEDLQQFIRDKFINIVDAEKCGLPRVLDTIEVSCKTRHNIKLLCNLIYDTVFSLKNPGSKELLLEQRVPASYLALEDVVCHIASERKQNNVDPVLNAEQYKAVVWQEMQYRYQRTFRDMAELHQATLFLHDNGVLLHYDDATLKDLYFLDPQWLCDMLAHVVTIREINPFARTGIMKLDDLKHVFKSSNLGPVDSRCYIVNLLNKFEVALTWDNRTLLIPSLLPAEDDMHAAAVKVKIPVRSRGWAVRNKKAATNSASTVVGKSSFFAGIPATSDALPELELIQRTDPELCVRRLLLMSYFPSGFWSRLITRILADDSIVDIVRSFFIIPKEVTQDARLAKLLDVRAEWVLWQTGMELRYSDSVLFRMKEVVPSAKGTTFDYKKLRLKLKQEGMWTDVDLQNSSILEILLPLDTLVIKRPITDEDEPIGYQAIVLDPSPECSAQLLSLAVDHIDILLEDWYPTLGTRFVHTSEGRFLVTRLVPCPRCLAGTQQDHEQDVNYPGRQHLAEAFRRAEMDHAGSGLRHVRKSQESYSDGDSGVDPNSAGSSRKTSVEGHPYIVGSVDVNVEEVIPTYSWMVEECILAAYDRSSVKCPTHGDISLAHIAPDTMFLDLGERHLIRLNCISRGKLLGRGAFGFVFKGTCRVRGSNDTIDVAMKMLQPVQPGPNASHSAIIAYKGAQGKWERDPLQYASKAYTTARQELNILLSLRHPNIVPLVGVCTRPLALVLDLAPQGALDVTLRHYRRSGAKLGPYTLQAIILQVAKAIEYLHQQHIIYRDLKSENVLVWSMPPPFENQFETPVHIKLADYGISRLTLPSGTKGFGGTEGFMAPEIMRYNGEEEYTEKVDCFSFGMFVYELLTLHQPFESHESVKECILEGGRPPLTHRETAYPTYILDLMVLCWCQQPRDRPSASQIVSIASAPEFTHLYDIVSLNHSAPVVATVAAPLLAVDDNSNLVGGEVWLSCSNSRADQLVVSGRACIQYSTLTVTDCPTAGCLVDKYIWLGDTLGQIHAFKVGDYQHIFSYTLDPSDTSSVTSLLHLSQQNRVAVGLSNGRIFLVRSDALPSASTMGEGSFVMSELGSSTVLHSITAVYKDNGRECELWCGESHGALSIYSMRENVVTGHEILNHFDPMVPNCDVLTLISSHSPVVYSDGPASVWTYVYPGCVVYQWDPDTRTIANKLDCSKLVPCSESMKSISIEEHLSPGRCQVTSLCVLHNELYIGTTWGCIVVAERASMRPITVFRPFQEEVSAIVALKPAADDEAFLMTLGRGYRSLIKRYKDVAGTPTLSSQSSQTQNNTYALLWAAQNWAAT